MLWQHWPSLVLTNFRWQREINDQLSDLIYETKNHNLMASLYLVGLSFAYGLLHSLGPGHGKMIVTTYLATHPTKIHVSLRITFFSAILQAVTAITLVSLLLMLFHSSMREVNNQAEQFIQLSFMAILILGTVIAYRAIKQLWGYSRTYLSEEKANVELISSAGQETICTKHKHTVDAKEINNATKLSDYISIIVSIGIRPCTGAIMVLLFSNLVNMYWLGVVSAFVMSIGTALTTSTIALMTISGKKVVKRYLRTTDRQTSVGALILQVLGGVIITLFGILQLNTKTYSIAPIL